MSRERVTIRDVAQRAGVSHTTVSFVVNGKASANISTTTQQRVWSAVRELDYQPDAAAISLSTARSNLIGFISEDIAAGRYAGESITGAQEAAWAQGKILLIVNTGRDPAIAAAAIDQMRRRRVEGLLVGTMAHRVVEPPAIPADVPTVLMNCYVPDRSLSSVVPDDRRGGYEATRELATAGHKRIGFVSATPAFDAPALRLAGYRAALDEAGLPFDPALVVDAHWTMDGGYAATSALFDGADPPTAIFAITDLVAMGVYEALKERRVRVPDDVAVVGFDNVEWTEMMRPPLTTMALPHAEMGHWAMSQLLRAIDGDQTEPAHARLECPLVRRQSV